MTGLIHPPHSECPLGGVTSKRNVARCSPPVEVVGRAAPASGRDIAATLPIAKVDFRKSRRFMRTPRSAAQLRRSRPAAGVVIRKFFPKEERPGGNLYRSRQ